MSKKGFRFQVSGLHCFSRQKFRRIFHQTMLSFLIVCIIYGCAAFPQPDSRNQPLIAGGDSVPGFSPIQFFQKYISPIDGDRCPMYPSCSAYSLEAFRKHGFLTGWIMTCDRLLRCGRDELKHAPRVIIGGEVYCHDPLAENEFPECQTESLAQ